MSCTSQSGSPFFCDGERRSASSFSCAFLNDDEHACLIDGVRPGERSHAGLLLDDGKRVVVPANEIVHGNTNDIMICPNTASWLYGDDLLFSPLSQLLRSDLTGLMCACAA